MTKEPEPRWATRESADKLRALFDLPLDESAYAAGWEIMCDFGERTEEFLAYYESASDLTEDDRFALMAMIVCSLDGRIAETGSDSLLAERLHRQLAADFALHEWTVSITGRRGRIRRSSIRIPIMSFRSRP